MFYFKNVCLIIFILFYSNSFSQNANNYSSTKGFILEGTIDGLQENETVYLILYTSDRHEIIYDTTIVKKSNFKFSGFIEEGPRLFKLTFEKHLNKPAVLFIDNYEQIKISGKCNIDKIQQGNIREFITIEGSPSDYAYQSLLNVNRVHYNFISRGMDPYLKSIKALKQFDPTLIEGIEMSKKIFNDGLGFLLKESIFFRPNPPIYYKAIPVFLSDLQERGAHFDFLPELYMKLDTISKSSFYGQRLGDVIKLSIGQPFPSFSLPNVDKKNISLQDVLTKSKVIVVNFWASNSYQRKPLHDELKSIYTKYKDKGLNVVGISSDTSAIEWKFRIEADGLPWLNVSDLKGRYGVVQKVYHEFPSKEIASTTNVVIDDQGRIVAWDVNGPELEWYIWKLTQ